MGAGDAPRWGAGSPPLVAIFVSASPSPGRGLACGVCTAAYTWTIAPATVTLQVVRFYLPAIGAISLLGAWLVTRIPGRAWLAGLTATAVIAALFGLGVWAFYAMYAAFGVPLSG